MDPQADAIPDYNSSEKEGFGDLASYAQIVFHERKTIFLICSIFFAVSAAFLSLVPNKYEAEVQILVEQLSDVEKLTSQMMTPNFRGEDDYYGTQVALITGKKISDRVESELGVSPGAYLLTAKRMRGTRIISVMVRSRDPRLAARVANKTVEVYTQEKGQDDLFVAKQMLKWLPNQAERMPTGAFAPAGDKSGKKDSSGLILTSEADDPVYQQLRQSKMETETKLKELSYRYKPGYPLMKELSEKLVYLDQQIKERKDALVGNLKASLAGDFRLTNIKVLSQAPVPTKPTSPKRAQGVFLATFLGLLVSICFIIYIEQTDPRIWYESDIRKAIDVPLMGYVPLIPNLARRKDKKNKILGVSTVFTENLRLQNLIKDNATLADAVAIMRTHLFFSVPYQKSKVLIMTSTTPNEGKSTVIGLFALSLASMGKKILMIDGDLRRPYLHIHLGIENQKGMSEYLSGEARIEDIVRLVPDSPLKIITGGMLRVSSAHLLSSSSKFKELLDAFSEDYDYILVDAPPVLFIPDGLIMAKYVQGVVLITSAGMIRRQVLQTTKRKFDAINRPVVGSVINRANLSMDIRFQKYFKQYKDYYYSDVTGSEATERQVQQKHG